MTKSEATSYARDMNRHGNLYAEVVRIPAEIDPPKPNENGWDVKITRLYDANNNGADS